MKKTERNMNLIVTVLLLTVLICNLFFSWHVQKEISEIRRIFSEKKKTLPCESVPISWAVSNYECANSLLSAMNVTNVKFNPPGTADQLRRNSSVFTRES